jgi:hypothetical protein
MVDIRAIDLPAVIHPNLQMFHLQAGIKTLDLQVAIRRQTFHHQLFHLQVITLRRTVRT